MKTCNICKNIHHAKGLCRYHYGQTQVRKDYYKQYFQKQHVKEKQKERYLRNREKILRYHKEYSKRPEVKTRLRTYWTTPKYREKRRIHWHKPESKKRYRAYLQRPEVKERKRLQNKEWYMKLRTKIFSHYGNKCACCSESNVLFLSIDHINGGGNKHRRELGRSNIYTWLIKNNFPEGFQTLCMNCNMAKQWWGKCPHQDKRDRQL